ncbi:ATP-binding protein [Ammoniphilus sp. 3BR4]|uniref:ATP-binding protein n=1 Tax=Ammoniphilus sp. 3BR4 TaxID=3158265 RepID=UPI0034666E55
MVQETVKLLESQALIHRIDMLTDIPSHLPLVLCDQNQLKQVFMNIIKNAMESMPNGGELHIQVKLIDHIQISVSIIDQGCGIPQERLDRLGEPFYTTKEKGTGLGLMVTRKIFENHQGKMVIRSEVGKGTCVEVLFPVILSPEQSTVDEILHQCSS